MRRTQHGNNNPWCQNNDISWYDWRLAEKHADIHRFCSAMIAFRMRHPAFLRPEFFSGRNSRHNHIPDILWLTEKAEPADWLPNRHTLSLLIDGNKAEIASDRDDNDILIICNASQAEVSFTLAPVPAGKKSWFRAIDTAQSAGEDVLAPGSEARILRSCYTLAAHSMAVFLSR